MNVLYCVYKNIILLYMNDSPVGNLNRFVLHQTNSTEKIRVEKWFSSIGKSYKKNPLDMQYTLSNGKIKKEEKKNTFSSLNFVLNVINKIKPKDYNYVLTKEQAIRFIRVVEQYIVGNRNTEVTFRIDVLSEFNFTPEFIALIQKNINKLKQYHNISEADLAMDTPEYESTPVNIGEQLKGIKKMSLKKRREHEKRVSVGNVIEANDETAWKKRMNVQHKILQRELNNINRQKAFNKYSLLTSVRRRNRGKGTSLNGPRTKKMNSP